MSVCFVFIFLVITIALSSDTPRWQSVLIVPEPSDKCRHIRCSDLEDPKCIRVKYRKDLNNPLFIVAINLCELRFMKCHEHDGYEAALMSMKYCEHYTKVDVINKINDTNNLMNRDYIRGKREIAGEVVTKTLRKDGGNAKQPTDDDYSNYEAQAGYKIRLEDIYDEYQDWPLQKLKHKHLPSLTSDTSSKEAMSSSDQIDSLEIPTSASLEKNNGDYNQPFVNKEDENTVMPLISKESLVTPKVRAVYIDKRMEKDCPESCPIGRVMVCAKCQHGIYKTFSSVCHMRMFSCHHDDEKLVLIARYPCVLSAPYISDENMKPSGKVLDVHDNDEVLKFIRCRSLNKLDGNDPNCQTKEGLKPTLL